MGDTATDGGVLAVLGDLVEDVVVRIDSEPALGTDTPARIDRRRGGSAANVAAAAAGTGGGAVRFIGRVGADPLGDRLVVDLVDAGVDVRVQRAGRTGSVVVLVGPDGERTMLPDRAAAVELTDVDESWVDGATWLHLPAYSLVAEPVGAASLAVANVVRQRRGTVSVDMSSVAVVEAFGVDRLAELLADLRPAVVFANEPESALVPPGGEWVTVVKHGPDPVTAMVPGHPDIVVEVPVVEGVTDTTGAGDAFAAGYLVAAAARTGVRESVVAGIAQAGALLRSRAVVRG